MRRCVFTQPSRKRTTFTQLPAQNFLACTALNQRLLTETGRIGPDAYKRGREADPLWLGLIRQRPWHDAMGKIVSNTIYQRSGLTTAPTWQPILQSDGANVNGCIPPLTVISNASTLTQYQLYHLALEGDPLCLNDIVTANEPRRALEAIQDNLMGNANYVKKERYRSEYERLCQHKVVIAPGLPEDSAGFPLVQPTSPVTFGVLRKYYRQLQREADGTTGVNKIAKNSRGATQFMFVSSGETIENAVKADNMIREDFHYSDRANELLGAFNNNFSYGGFIMWEDSFPPRYNWTGSDYVRISEYTGSATTLGTKLEINPAWNNAQYEVSYIFHPDVMISRVPSPETSFGDVKYRAQNYALEWRWINEFDRNCNPDRNIGYFRAVGQQASESVFPQFGYALMGLRCDVQLSLIPCSSGSGYSSTGVYSGPDSATA